MLTDNPNQTHLINQNNGTEPMVILHYVHDPMCAWCWCFRNVWLQLQQQIKTRYPNLIINPLVGGLAPDNNEPMVKTLQLKLMETWRLIETTYNVEFNHSYWQLNIPKRSTYWACRAVLTTAEMTADNRDDIHHQMVYHIQQAYYLQAKNPSELDTLVNCAANLGFDKETFSKQLQSKTINTLLAKHISFARSIGGNSFPSLILEKNNTLITLPNEYQNPLVLMDSLSAHLA